MSYFADLTVAVCEAGVGNVYHPKYAATLVDTTDLDPADEAALEALTGYGDTRLEAVANLLNLAVAMQKQKEGAHDHHHPR